MINDQAPISPDECPVCQGIFQSVDQWVDRAVEAAQDVEFETYLVGTHVPTAVEQAEDQLWTRHGLTRRLAEPIKQEFNREVGRAFERRLADRGCDVTVDYPTAVDDPLALRLRALSETRSGDSADALALQALSRPRLQTLSSHRETVSEERGGADSSPHRPCSSRRGPCAPRCGPRGHRRVYSPKVRTLDLETLQVEINAEAKEKIEVQGLANATRHTVREVKELEARKRYRAWVEFNEPISAGKLKAAAESLVNADIAQRTPRRVSHRRSDLVRRRRIHQLSAELTGEREAVVELLGDGGLYVKEFISGDDGRSTPSLAERLDVEARVTALDVLAVEAQVSLETDH